MKHTQKQIILSWLPTEDNDKVYPIKNVILLVEGEHGYNPSDWQMSREVITERNKMQGFNDADRIKAENFAMDVWRWV